MIQLRVSKSESISLLSGIQHHTLQDAINRNWTVDDDNYVRAQSVLWLFCWGKTGMGSEVTAYEVRKLWNELFSFSFEAMDSRVNHEYARKMRYAKFDIEQEFESLLNAPGC